MLSRRYNAAVQEGVLDQARTLAGAQTGQGAAVALGWRAAAAAVLAAAVFLVVASDRTARTASNGVPFSSRNVIGADMAGVSAAAADMLPIGASPSPQVSSAGAGATETETEHEERHVKPSPPAPGQPETPRGSDAKRPQPTAPAAGAACTTCASMPAGGEEATEVLFEKDRFALDVPALASEQPLVVNVGTRFAATLAEPVRTGPAAAPVTAAVDTDLQVRGRAAIPAGSRLVGHAFATSDDDLVRVLFTAAVVDGHTLSLSALALGPQNELGIAGRVLRKGSKAKRGAGHLLRGLGAAASVALAGPGGAAGAALGALQYGASAELGALTQDWNVSDKEVFVPAGTRVAVYLQGDLTVP